MRLATLGTLLLLAGSLLAAPNDAVAAAVKHAQTLPEGMAQHSRYLWLGALPAKDRARFLQTLSGQVNQISSAGGDPVPLTLAAPDLVRLDLRDYNLDPKTWEKLAGVDPYFHARLEVRITRRGTTTRADGVHCTWDWEQGRYVPTFRADGSRAITPGCQWTRETETASAFWLDPAQAAALITLTQSAAPVVRADWFLVQTARQLSPDNRQTGVGYYDWLKLKSRDDLFRLIEFDEKKSKRLQFELRAALDTSGVSQQNRQIVRFKSLTGGLWITLDSKSNVGRGNAVRNLRDGDYDHQAEEIYGVLPNGLPVTWAGTDKGERQDSAPDFVGPDDSPKRAGRDARIHVCLSCTRCHGKDVLRPINDWARRTYNAGGPVLLQSPDYQVYLDLRRQYLSDLDTQLTLDRLGYTLAIARATGGLDPGQFADGLADAWNVYVERPVTLESAAAEEGVEPKRLQETIRRALLATGQVDPVLAAWVFDPARPIRRSHYEEVYPLLQYYWLSFAPR